VDSGKSGWGKPEKGEIDGCQFLTIHNDINNLTFFRDYCVKTFETLRDRARLARPACLGLP
jgi:hypothetical protein